MLRAFQALLILLLVVIGAVFTAQNAQPVRLHLVVSAHELPLAAVLLACLLFGVLLGLLFNLAQVWGLRRRLGRLRREAELARQEVANLRAIPVKDPP